MCGLVGFLGEVSLEQLHAMGRLIRHRGPDDIGHYFNPAQRVGLLHARLSIIDVAGGKQPLANEDRSIIVIFNGEIYNHEALRRECERKGHTMATHSDGEVISHLYEEYGIAFVSKLRGMFAIALWDATKEELYLIRDRFGIKPIYYTETNGGVVFASEIKALLPLVPPPELDTQALYWYLTFRYVPSQRTGFNGIHKLEPACWAAISRRGVTIHKYWNLAESAPPVHDGTTDWAGELRDRLTSAIDMRLMSEVPVGAFLSGGLDSSFIVGLMTELNRFPVETFSFGVGERWHNESRFAALVADYNKTHHHSLSGDCNDVDTLRSTIYHLDEPLGDTAIVPTYLLSKLTREYVTVSLMGEGADELLAGYDKYKVIRFLRSFGRMVPCGVAGVLSRVLRNHERAFRACDFVRHRKNFARAYVGLASVFREDELAQLVQKDLLAEFRAQVSPEVLIENIVADVSDRDLLDQLMYIDINTWLPNDVLLKADKMTMAHALEGRVPFLDHELAEWMFAMPSKYKLRGMTEKYILREAMTPYVPAEIKRRRKHGFTVSLNPWLEGADNIVQQSLSESSVNRRGWFNYEYVKHLLEQDLDRDYNRRKVVSLLFLEEWAKTFLDGTGLGAALESTAQEDCSLAGSLHNGRKDGEERTEV